MTTSDIPIHMSLLDLMARAETLEKTIVFKIEQFAQEGSIDREGHERDIAQRNKEVQHIRQQIRGMIEANPGLFGFSE